MDACPLCFYRSYAVGSASAIFLATRRTNPSVRASVRETRPTPVGQLHVPTSRAGRLPFSPRKAVSLLQWWFSPGSYAGAFFSRRFGNSALREESNFLHVKLLLASLQACIPAFAGPFSERIRAVLSEKGVFRIRPSLPPTGFPGLRAGLLHDSAAC